MNASQTHYAKWRKVDVRAHNDVKCKLVDSDKKEINDWQGPGRKDGLEKGTSRKVQLSPSSDSFLVCRFSYCGQLWSKNTTWKWNRNKQSIRFGLCTILSVQWISHRSGLPWPSSHPVRPCWRWYLPFSHLGLHDEINCCSITVPVFK